MAYCIGIQEPYKPAYKDCYTNWMYHYIKDLHRVSKINLALKTGSIWGEKPYASR